MRSLLLVATLTLAACQPASEPPSLGIPTPAGLELLDAPVRAQYEARRRALEADRTDADRWGELGLWFDAYEQWPAAAHCYARAVELDFSWRWSEHLAHAHRLTGNAESAAHFFSTSLVLQPGRAAPAVWLGELQLAQGQPEQARQTFETLLRSQPGHVRATAGLARAIHALGRPAEAVELLEPLLEKQPESGALHHALGLASRDAGDTARAENHLRIAAAQGAKLTPIAMDDPILEEVAALRASARSESERASSSLREGSFDDALTRLQAARDADPENATAILNLARGQARLGEPAVAVDTLAPLLEREPGHSRALEVRALARSLDGDMGGALDDYRAATVADPDNLGAHRQLARLLWQRGERVEALPHLEAVTRLDPGDVQAHYRRDLAAIVAGRWPDAIAWLERDAESRGAAFRLVLARALATAPQELQDGDRALALALEQHAATPRLMQAETVAMAHAARGDFEQALAWQRAAWLAVEEAGRGADCPWVAERLAGYEANEKDALPFRPEEKRVSVRVAAPERASR